jgi:hypothetical protein
VWAYNEETGEKSLQEVVHLIQGEGTKALVDITFATGEVITATAGHPFYLPNEKEWMDAGDLTADQVLLDFVGNPLGILGINAYSEQAKVYNLTVDNDHTYYVGVSGALSHNAQKICSFEGLDIGAIKPKLKTNPKHTKGGGGKKGNEPAGLEPYDADYALKNLSVKSSETGHWYAKSPDGKSVYRYFVDRDGVAHWSGSTGDLNAPLALKHIPNAVKKAFGVKSKGNN